MTANPIKHLLTCSIFILDMLIRFSFFVDKSVLLIIDYLFLVSPSFGKLPDGGFDVAAQLLRQTVHLHLFRFLGGVRVG